MSKISYQNSCVGRCFRFWTYWSLSLPQRRIQYNSESVHVPGLYLLVLKLRNKFSKAILMQDGAKPHTALSTRTFLRQQSTDRIIGKHFTKEWPAQSPDLTTADYYLWPQLKYKMYQGQQPFKSIRSLKRAITHHTNKLRDVNRGHLLDSVLKGGGSALIFVRTQF